MKRLSTGLLALGLVCLGAGVLNADVKTQERTQVKFEGMLGRMMGMFGGKAAKEGIVSSVAVKGDRKMTVNDTTGEIIDLGEEKIYHLDMKKKTYTVTTFAELRKQMEDARAKAEKQAKEAPKEEQQPQAGQGKEMEVDFDVKNTGQTKTIAGHQTHEVVVTVTVREKGKTLQDSGGLVTTADTWMADRIPALAEVQAFDRRYYQKLAGPVAVGASAEQMAAAMAMYPGMKAAMERMQKEGGKMDGTPLASTTTIESVKSQQQLAEQKSSESESGGGGIGGMLARKMMKKKTDDSSNARATVMTTMNEVLSIEAAASASDVAIPAGFKEKQ